MPAELWDVGAYHIDEMQFHDLHNFPKKQGPCHVFETDL